jgi:hypothetical protein
MPPMPASSLCTYYWYPKEYFKKKYININPEYIKFVEDKDHNLVLAIVMPSFLELYKKANGKLFPFGFYHLLNARNNSKDVTFTLLVPTWLSKQTRDHF